MFVIIRRAAVIAVLAASSATCARGAAPAADTTPVAKTNLTTRFEALRDQYGKAAPQIEQANLYKAQDALTAYGRGLDSALAALKKQGNLDAFLLAQEEKKRFEAEKTVPEVSGKKDMAEIDRLAGVYKKALGAARDGNAKATLALNKRYELAWDSFVKESVQANEIELAKNAKEELMRVRRAIQAAAAEPAGAVNPKPNEDPEDEPTEEGGKGSSAEEPPAGAPPKSGLPSFLQKGLVLYYSFDRSEVSKLTDKSGRGNQGKNHGAKWTAKGKVGPAYQFAGGSDSGAWIQVENSASLSSPQSTRQLTICLWMKPDSLPAGIPDLVCKGGNQPPAANDGYELFINNSSLGLCSGPREAYIASHWIAGHMGEWMHVAVTLDATTGKVTFYINGKDTQDVNASGDWSSAKFAVPNKCYIGRPDPGHHANRSWFDGSMDEIMIFSRALTAKDVKEIYNAQK